MAKKIYEVLGLNHSQWERGEIWSILLKSSEEFYCLGLNWYHQDRYEGDEFPGEIGGGDLDAGVIEFDGPITHVPSNKFFISIEEHWRPETMAVLRNGKDFCGFSHYGEDNDSDYPAGYAWVDMSLFKKLRHPVELDRFLNQASHSPKEKNLRKRKYR